MTHEHFVSRMNHSGAQQETDFSIMKQLAPPQLSITTINYRVGGRRSRVTFAVIRNNVHFWTLYLAKF